MKKSNLHNITYAFILAVQFPWIIFSQTVQLDGLAYLEGQADHNGIKVVFERFAPQDLFDSTYLDCTGSFAIHLGQGLYNISYSKDGFISSYLEGIEAYSDITLPETTLEQEGLTGSISGLLEADTYIITGDIQVDHGDTLIIEPGTTLRFKPETNFWISGLLMAEGTATSPILFTKYDENTGWMGIFIGTLANDNSVISNAIIEYSEAMGISIGGSSPTIRNSVIRYNHNTYYQAHGGGIYLSNTDAILENLEVYGNVAALGGGLYVNQVTSNQGEYYRPVINNCIFYENTANDGGGIYFEVWIYNGVFIFPLLINSTVSKNSSSGVSGSAETWMPDLINNNISYNNGYGLRSQLGVINYCGYNNVSNNSAGNFYNPPQWIGENITVNSNADSCDAYHNIQLDPLFESLEENDFHLTAESPCIDAGLNDSVLGATDFDGNPRILYGVNSLTVDMGAYESLPIGFGDHAIAEIPDLIISPNPAQELVQISFPKGRDYTACSLWIYNSAGVKLQQFSPGENSSTFLLNVGNYMPGLYFAVVSDDRFTMARGKFLVVRQ